MLTNKYHLEAQAAAAVGSHQASSDIASLENYIRIQNGGYRRGLDEFNQFREALRSPEHILGNPSTKHGEIAELLEVHFTRAKKYVNLQEPSATFKGAPRTGPIDYFKDGKPYQSKFINGENNTLKHVLDHVNKNFDNNPGLKYNIPKDQYNVIYKINNDQFEGLNLNAKSINAIKRKIHAFEDATGQKFNNVVKPGNAEYAEVQKGRIHETINQRESYLKNENERRLENNEKKYGNFGEGFAIALGKGFIIGYSMNLGRLIIQEKSFDVLMSSDAHKEALRGGVIGAASSGGGYLLMNGLNVASPVVAGIVATSHGVIRNIKLYRNGDIDMAKLKKNLAFSTGEGGLISSGAYIGQALIPLPVAGAIIGTFATRYTIGAGRQVYNNDLHNKALIKSLYDYQVELSKYFEDRINQYTRISNYSLAQSALSADSANANTHRLRASIDAHNTTVGAKKEPIRNTHDVDKFMRANHRSFAA